MTKSRHKDSRVNLKNNYEAILNFNEIFLAKHKMVRAIFSSV